MNPLDLAADIARGAGTPRWRDAHAAAMIRKQAAASQVDKQQAWEEGHEHCFHVEDPANTERNPYV